jgi:hypothetical protein
MYAERKHILGPTLDSVSVSGVRCPVSGVTIEVLRMYVTPHMVTNFFQERGLPIWEIFCPPARSGTGTPRMVMGIGVFAFP